MAAAIRHLEGTQAGARSLVISTKISAPPITATLAARPRLRRLITELIANHRVVVVSATAGAGKTTAVVEVVHALEQPVAWLAVDQTDVAPGRLLTYLETAIAGALTEVKGVVGNALAAGLGHVEAAGLLADAVAGAELVLVLDDLERLGDAAEPWSVIDAFLRYAGPNLRTVLISRRDVPAALSAMRPAAGATAAVDEDDLAFTADEAAQALAVLGRDAADAAEVVDATGGWVTGVLFEAWRAAGHVPGTGGGADPLHGYLSAHIVGQLAEADREFLISTSVLDEVTIARAVALGHADAAERIAALQTRRLPVLWRAAPITMRCHPRLREYLHTLLQRREPDAVRSLQIKYATLLAAEGHFEEATEVLLRAGEPQKALAMAERSIFTVIERLDIETADRWLRELSAVAPRGVNVLTEAELMLAFTVGDSIRCVSIVDDLPPEQLERLAAGAGRAGAFVVWALLNCARVDDARGLLAVVPDGPLVEALRYRFWLTQDLEPGGKPVRPLQHDRLFGGLVLITDYFLGRLVDPDDDPASSWGNMVAAPWRIGMVRARGQTQRALELLEQARATSGRAYELTRRMSVDSEVLIDAGRREEARQAIVRMRRLAGYDTSLVSLNALAEVKLLLRLDGDQLAALAVLDRLHATPGARDIAWEAEIADTFYGFALLLEGRDADALAPLRRAVDGMVGGDRILELPTAATYLSEAEWRAGNEDAADRAADVALEAAQRQGSNHLLLQALADVPAVVARRIDAEPAADSAWHALGRILHARGVRLSVHPTSIVRFRDWGERSIEIDGRPARPRVAKSYEVLAYLLAQTDRAADRERLLTAVFDGRGDDSTRAYLRQAIGSLRSVLPDGALTTSPSGPIRISEELAVSSTSGQLESGLAEASRLQGADRLAALQQLIDQMGAGEYLPGGRSGWVDERRERFVGLRTDAQLQAAELAFELGALDRACDLVNAVLEADPYREAGWRLKMRVAAAFGDDDAVIRTYRDLKRALTEIGAAPASGSRKLLDALRR